MKTISAILFSLTIYANSVNAAVIWYPMPPEAYKFGNIYPEAQHLLYAFDYGHAVVYEKLLNSGGIIPNPQQFEKDLLTEIIAILKNPPTTKVDEDDIAPQ